LTKTPSKSRKKVAKTVSRVVSASPGPNNSSDGFFSRVGGALGSAFGPTGAMLGSMAGKGLASIVGFGDYTVNSNSLTKIQGAPRPSFRNNGDGVEICHSEFLADVSGSTGFNVSAYPINPGVPGTFPWLSQIAANFEEYIFEGLVFQYRPSSGTIAAASPALGVVCYATNYDVLDAVFTSKQAIDAYEYSTSCLPMNTMDHPVECRFKDETVHAHYVRYSPVPANADARLYDLGLFQVATKGMQTVYTCGELWVTYHVRLLKPKISPTIPAPYMHYVSSPVGSASTASPQGTTGMMAITTALAGTENLITPGFGCNINMGRVGRFLVKVNFFSTIGPFTSYASATCGSALRFVNCTNNFTASAEGGLGNSSGGLWVMVDVLTPGATANNLLTITPPTGYSSGNTDWFVTALDALVNP